MVEGPGETAQASGRIAGRYKVERLLGQGGMGTVYAVVDETSGERVALKRAGREGRRDPEVSLFEREYHTLASLRHPLIVHVYAYGVDALGPYYTMEPLDGSDLSGAAPMPWREVCSCLRDVASTLGVLHARRLVHRDLSPRNLFRTSAGQLKLLDFGALAAFGHAGDVVGTPPLMAPEVLRRAELDARTDLFALGALGYWLLTGTHAFPARELAALEAMWAYEPTAPSQLVKLIPGADHSVPEALDELLCGLLRIDIAERARTAADVVDSLNAIGDLTPEPRDLVERGYLDSSVFVGRSHERCRFKQALSGADEGKPGALSLEGPEGIGRTRLLAELSLLARLSGATVLSLDGSTGCRPFGLAESLGQCLLTALPSVAREAAAPLAQALGGCSARLGEWLGAGPSQARSREHQRSESLTALCEWVGSITRLHTLVVLVDDMHLADEESQALLAMLAHAEASQRLLLVSSTPTEHARDGLSAHESYRQAAQRVTLAPLAEVESLELLRSMFGDVPNLQRTSARLHLVSEGRPSGLIMLARHLVHNGVVQYQEGAWALPTDLPTDLPSSSHARILSALQWLPPEARQLAATLSVPDYGPITPRMCRALFEVDDSTGQAWLAKLVETGAVRRVDNGVQPAHRSIGTQLLRGLTPERRRHVHRVLAESLHADAGAEQALMNSLREGLHWLRAGDYERGQSVLTALVRREILRDGADLPRAVAGLEDWLELLDARGAGDLERAPALAGLSAAGYLVDLSCAIRFGDQTRDTLERLLCLRLARTLTPVLGGKSALLLALAVAGAGLRVRRATLTLQELLNWFMTIMSSIAGGCAAVVDVVALQRHVQALAPFEVLGEDHIAGLVPRFARGLLAGVQDRPAESLRIVAEVIARLRSPRPIKSMTPDMRAYMLAGAIYCNAVRLNLANRQGALEMADEVEKVGPVQAQTAEFARAGHYASFGDMAAARQARKRLELLAIQIGRSWQAECLAPMQDLRTAFWTWNAAAMKRAAHDVRMLSSRYPSTGFFEREARACYALMRGRFTQARQLILDHPVEPLSVVGWGRQRGVLAAAYNGLGQHIQALEVCRDVLLRVTPADLDFVQLFLPVQVEEAVALCGLGQAARACELLDGYLARYADRGPLILAYLHRARAKVALAAGALDACEHHVAVMTQLVVPLQIPSLHSAAMAMQKMVVAHRHSGGKAPITALFADEAALMTQLQLLLTQAGDIGTERSVAALRLVTQATGASGGFLMHAGGSKALATEGEPPDSALLSWTLERIAAAGEDPDTVSEDESSAELHSGCLQLGGRTHVLSVLWHPGVDEPVGALVLSFEGSSVRTTPDSLRRALAAQLWETNKAG